MVGGVKQFALAGVVAWATLGSAQAAEVNLYTTREPGLIKPLLDAYQTGPSVSHADLHPTLMG